MLDKVFIVCLILIITISTIGCINEEIDNNEKISVDVIKVECQRHHPAVGTYSLYCKYNDEEYKVDINLKNLSEDLKERFWLDNVKSGDVLYCRLKVNSEGEEYLTDFSLDNY